MIKRDELATPTSCLNKADMDEPIFVLRGNDPNAANTVRQWAESYRQRKAEHGSLTAREQEKYTEAMALATKMDHWRVTS